ncbi:anaerobic dimethyl sulfoxide reductase, A subunit, DmsA/YnfE family protein [Shewanella sediminis HAW-EB3]|uniref:Anaerobic dimethyl sulfoxide reductase, A subunit, DmsA/YnfE family protein n=1 Tax=Shewanella sediminis (strain HAW-EB3) TaxID=425104 RepID=A8FSU5_SHESH|nr:DMSO/selenate family reductase complex A subunit [Shewanella sediminis]ABV35918.1 anaerobic dimethyl sulfoxide reductase, A subunit, DmsA/YnfE family protein [Shewanella sediminis HAW-EB3]
MQRREFLKLSAAASAVTCVTACGSKKTETIIPEVPVSEKHFWSACLGNCGSNCPLKVITVDGKITRIEPETYGEDSFDSPHIRPCLRGHANRARVYNPDRLMYPMKRIANAKRGEGKFERISWEQATSEIGMKLKETYDQYGPRAVYQNRGSGAFYDINGKYAWGRLLNCMGGGLKHYGSYSSSMVRTIMPYIFGSRKSSTPREMKYSDLLVFFGYNPLETRMSGSGEGFEVQTVTEGKKVIHIDCRYSDSAMGRESEYYPCRPGTDAALCEAMAYVLITEELLDEQFLSDKCYGFRAEPSIQDARDSSKMLPEVVYEDSYEAHILGVKDGQPKTPQWAAEICGIPADSIRNIARQIGNAKAPYLAPGLGMQRHINGEDNIRSVMTLGMLVGAIGKRGTNTGDYPKSPRKIYSKGLPTVSEQQEVSIDDAKISMFSWTQAVENGENLTVLRDGVKLPAEELDENGDGKLGTNIKAIINFASGCLVNQHGDAFGTTRILQDESKCEMIVVIDNHMTSSAKLADYILPDNTWLESTDFANKTYYAGAVSYMTALKTGIKPLGECRGSFDVCTDLAEKMGVKEIFTEGRTTDEWIEHYYQTKVRTLDPELFPATAKEMQDIGVVKTFSPCDDSEESAKVNCAMWDYVQNGGTLKTASGKLEIFSHALQELSDLWEVPDYWLDKDNYLNAIPKYWVGLESYQDPSPELKDKPLQLIGHHTKARTHSTFGSVKWLKEAVNGDAVWINPDDAIKYGIVDDQYAIIESLRGKVKVKARVTNRIMPGVMSLSQGAWFDPKNDVDVGGCVNALTSQGRPSPLAKGNPQHTNRVRIYKA